MERKVIIIIINNTTTTNKKKNQKVIDVEMCAKKTSKYVLLGSERILRNKVLEI